MNKALNGYMDSYRELASKTSFDPVNDAELAALKARMNRNTGGEG